MEPAESSAKKRFGAELKAHRTARGWTQAELGKKLGYSGSFISDVERGDRGASEDFATRCDEAVETPGTFLRLWEDLQREEFPVWFAPIVPIEREATKINGWELGAVPGLLQTEQYARALIRARLDKLIKAADTPGYVLQVLSFSAQAHAGIDGHLYLYERLGQPVVAYTECFGGGRLVEDSQEVSTSLQ